MRVERMYHGSKLGGLLSKQHLESFCHITHEYLAPVLWAPHQVKLERKHSARVALGRRHPCIIRTACI